MRPIIAGSPATFTVTVMQDGKPMPVDSVSAAVYPMSGQQALIESFALSDEDDGADWPNGVVAVSLTAEQTGGLQPGEVMLVLTGDFGIKRFRMIVETLFQPTRTSLFIRDIVIDEIRRDRLMAAAAGVLGAVEVSDDYLWDKIRAAESEISNTLRVPLVPTRFFPQQPTEDELAELGDMPWQIEIGTDYQPDMFARDKWGFLITRQKPIISVERLRFAYPVEQMGHYEIPLSWLNIDAKYGHVRIVPASNAVLTSLSGFMLVMMAEGRVVPSLIQLTYTAGLTDVNTNYPELLDAIKKKAVLKVVADAYLPQSGSVSSDGHSQSISVDMAKYQETVDHILFGSDGSNGGLMAKIHGIRTMVL